MKLPPRTGWMNAQSQPPVNGGPDAVYEVTCPRSPFRGDVGTRTKAWLRGSVSGGACGACQWRGLTKPKEKTK